MENKLVSLTSCSVKKQKHLADLSLLKKKVKSLRSQFCRLYKIEVNYVIDIRQDRSNNPAKPKAPIWKC